MEKGLLGHSDADVLIHAVMDDCLEPPHLETSANIFRIQIRLIREFPVLNCWFMWRNCLEKQGYAVGNIDATVIAQKPKMAPHIPQMRKKYGRCTWNSGIKDQYKGNDRRRTPDLQEEEKGLLLRQSAFLSRNRTELQGTVFWDSVKK